MDLFERVSEDIKNAMRAKDKVALETLRNIKKVFLEAKTAPGANDTLTDADALKIIQKLTKQGKDAAEIYVQQARRKKERGRPVFERPYEMVLAIALAVLALIAIFMIATGRIRPF